MGRHGHGREERHAYVKGMARAGTGNSIWQGRVGNSMTSVRGRVVQCSKIELYMVDTTTHLTSLGSRGQRRIE